MEIMELLHHLNLAPSQIKLNGWRYFFSCCAFWPLVLGECVTMIVRKCLNVYMPVRYLSEQGVYLEQGKRQGYQATSSDTREDS